MDRHEILSKLPGALLPWYAENHRDLPWRRDKQPYHVWLSEIMLQQTRVEAVKGYYSRFLQTLPTISTLANADDELLHKLWEGLGYYSRVRNLKKAAQTVMEKHGGCFPAEHADVLALPGIGEYTAGAICSICYDARTPAVDGNVLRVVSRLTEDTAPIDQPASKKTVSEDLALIYPAQAGDYTQALMELGATVCIPNGKPKCEICPCRDFCRAHLHGTEEKFPLRSPKKGKRMEKHTVFILSCDGKFALQKRPGKGLLAGLWEFPNLPGWLEAPDAMAAVEQMGLKPRQIFRRVERNHIFTHIRWELWGYFLEVAEPAGAFAWHSAAEIEAGAALPTAFRQFWEEMKDV